jgi:hypothetical protein
MEPVFMLLGQSAATAAALAIDASGTAGTGLNSSISNSSLVISNSSALAAVQDVPYPALRARLLADGQRL